MTIKTISTQNAPAAIGPYSQAVAAGGAVYTSGQIPLDAVTGQVVGTDITTQTAQALRNLAAVLAAAGVPIDHVVKTTCYLADMADFAAFNAVYETVMMHRPARSCVAVKDLPRGVLVEVEAIAVL